MADVVWLVVSLVNLAVSVFVFLYSRRTARTWRHVAELAERNAQRWRDVAERRGRQLDRLIEDEYL